MRLAIQNIGSSSKPWRLVDLDTEGDRNGPQQVCVTVRFRHPALGPTFVDEAVGGDTQRECVDVVLGLLGKMIELRRQELAQAECP